MRRDITKEALTQAISELGSREKVAERFGVNLAQLRGFARNRGVKLPTPVGKSMAGRNGEYAVYAWLKRYGYTPQLSKYNSPYDLLCNGKRVEVKCSEFSKGTWSFNIHRHNKINEQEVDVYVLRLESVPGFKYAVHLILPAPIGKSTVDISMRSLLTRYSRYYNRFDLLNS